MSAQANRSKLNWQREQQWADDLRARLSRRMEDLSNQERLSALPPRLLGCALVVPAGYFASDTSAHDCSLARRSGATRDGSGYAR